jgi:hypothetical protein
MGRENRQAALPEPPGKVRIVSHELGQPRRWHFGYADREP